MARKTTSILTAVVVGLFSLNVWVPRSKPALQDWVAAKHLVRTLADVVELQSQRRLIQAKVDRIIERFNPEMKPEVRKAVFDEILEMSLKYDNLDVDLICATITHESGRTWDPRVVSRAGAMGLMQIMPETGRWLAQYEHIPWTSAEDVLFNPVYNIRLGCRYLSVLIDTYDLDGGLAAYNGGETIVRRWLAHNKAEGILWDETSSYVPFVLKLYDEFKSYRM